MVITAEIAPIEIDLDGVARVGGTRVTLATVLAAFHDGVTAEEIVYQYPWGWLMSTQSSPSTCATPQR
jgi:hypothetical protein